LKTYVVTRAGILREKIRVGVFSPNDPRPWVRSENLDLMLEHERSFMEALRKGFYVLL